MRDGRRAANALQEKLLGEYRHFSVASLELITMLEDAPAAWSVVDGKIVFVDDVFGQRYGTMVKEIADSELRTSELSLEFYNVH